MATISIVRWDEFQHYRDRDPPWIKLYRDTLTSLAWMMGNDHSKLLMCALMLIAARYKNEIPADPLLVKRMAHLEMDEKVISETLEKLVELEFLEIHGLTINGKSVAKALLANRYTEKERSEQERSEQSRAEQSVELEIRPVEAVFAHWQKVWNKPRAKLDPKRRATISRALKAYDQATLCESISGYKNSTHHNGVNDRNTVYDEIALFLRDAAHIDAGLQHANGPVNGKPARRIAKTVAELELEEAQRNAKH